MSQIYLGDKLIASTEGSDIKYDENTSVKEKIDELNSNLGVRYNSETDYIEILYNGVWYKSLRAFIQSLKLIENGYMVDDFYGNGYTQNADNISVPSLKWLAIKVDLTKYTKIVANYSTTTGSNSESWDCLGVLNGNVNITSADGIQSSAVKKSLTKSANAQNYVNKEIDVSGLNGEYIIALCCYGKTLTVTKLQVL